MLLSNIMYYIYAEYYNPRNHNDHIGHYSRTKGVSYCYRTSSITGYIT